MEEEALGQGKVVYWIAFDSGSERERKGYSSWIVIAHGTEIKGPIMHREGKWSLLIEVFLKERNSCTIVQFQEPSDKFLFFFLRTRLTELIIMKYIS